MERIERNEKEKVLRGVKRFLLAFALFCLLIGAIGCTAHDSAGEEGEDAATEIDGEAEGTPIAAGPAPGLYLPPEKYPRVDGSTLTIPFSEAVAATVMDLPSEEARLYVLHNKTHEAYMNLIDGNADIIFATPPSEEELAHAKERGVELRLIPILNDAFVFFVNAENPTDDVNRDALVGIYSGKIKNWSELGGEDAPINAYQRPENSGSQTGLIDLVMKGTPLAPAPTEKVFAEMGDI
ncbi:MAG: substrate-binding domain-containing protein, partial [Clostridiales Family XIII bacterium]|nr:substrate-binding domain-containing protein [Clostridiales Family XIII bacterium]